MGKVIEVLGHLQAERRAIDNSEFADAFPESPYDVMNLGTVQGGLATNIIAEQCVLRASYRSLPKIDPLALYDEIKRRLGAIDPHDYASGSLAAAIEVDLLLAAPPMWSNRGSSLEKVLFEVTGNKSTRGAQFATDGAWFSGAGIQCLICGPGDYDQAHQPNESIRREAFERGPAMIARVIEQTCM
jgi:acetylornithine deacetylase